MSRKATSSSTATRVEPRAQPATKSATVREVPISQLKPHPQQAKLFPANETDIERLKADIASRGLDRPIEVTPDLQIIAGHSRWEACKRLGKKTVPVIVRDDLASPQAILNHLIKDNLVRRQLTAVAKARLIVALVENETGRKLDNSPWGNGEKVKLGIAQDFGVSLRSVNRWLAVNRLPAELQAALECGKLKHADAYRLAYWPGVEQNRVAQLIARGENGRTAMAKVRPPDPNSKAASRVDALLRLCRALGKYVPTLENGKKEVPELFLVPNRDVLVRGAQLLQRLVSRIESAENSAPDTNV